MTVSETFSTQPGNLTSEELLKKLRAALQRDGDFPASAKVVSELRARTSDPKTTANQVTELILREPSLGTRVLHLVNSSFYRRAKPIMTVSQAVVQIGMRPIAELCAGVVLLQKFVPAARRGGAFAECLQKTIVTSLLTSSLAEASGSADESAHGERGYLAGSFAELGTLLLAYYFPQIYEAAHKRAAQKQQTLSKSIHEITGVSPFQLSAEVIEALKLPPFYKDLILQADEFQKSPPSGESAKATEELAKVLRGAEKLSHALTISKDRKEFDAALKGIGGQIGLEGKKLRQVVTGIEDTFQSHCQSLDLQLPRLPEYVESFGESDAAGGKAEAKDGSDPLAPFIDEIRLAVEARETTSSIITSVMECLAFGIGFERVVLLLLSPDKKRLHGRMALGDMGDVDPRAVTRELNVSASGENPDVKAFVDARAIVTGTSILPGGKAFAAIPVGFGQRAIGVVFADKHTNSAALTSREEAAIGVLAELLNRSLSMSVNYEK